MTSTLLFDSCRPFVASIATVNGPICSSSSFVTSPRLKSASRSVSPHPLLLVCASGSTARSTFPSSTPQEAVDEAFRIAGQDASVILLPYGYDTLPIIT